MSGGLNVLWAKVRWANVQWAKVLRPPDIPSISLKKSIANF